jgi:PhnB protein
MVTPYVTFPGNCREALALYAKAFGSDARMVRTYGDYVPEGVQHPPEDLRDWILHAEMEIAGTAVWFADEVLEKPTRGSMVKLVATAPSAAEGRRIFGILAEGGHVTLPPTETFYSTFHAGLIDPFGVSWNIVAEEAPTSA